MTVKSALVLFVFIATIHLNFAQEEECKNKQSIFHEHVKAKNYEAAYEPWQFVRRNCPGLSMAIYTDGERILQHKISTSADENKIKHIEDLVLLWQQRFTYFPKRTPLDKFTTKSCQLQYDNKDLLKIEDEDLYTCFDEAFVTHQFTHPKSLYTYFSLMVDLHDAKKRSIKEVFNSYDDIKDRINTEVVDYTKRLNRLIEKREGGAELAKKEVEKEKSYRSYLKNYALISKNMDIKLGNIANCENLIPFYTKEFESHKKDSIWLKRAVNRMYHKECTEDLLYENTVKAYDGIANSAETKYFVAIVLINKGKFKEAVVYLEEAIALENEDLKKAKYATLAGRILRKTGSYPKARTYFRKALKFNPSDGKPHLHIARMYRESAKNCGDSNFNKRAIYWIAAQEARKAGKKDASLRRAAAQDAANYEALAPAKKEIHECACAGETIQISCWIGGFILVPEI